MPAAEFWLLVAQAALAVIFLVMASLWAFTLNLGHVHHFFFFSVSYSFWKGGRVETTRSISRLTRLVQEASG